MYHAICNVDQLSNGECASLEAQDSAYFVVRYNDQWFAYKNACPHLGLSLDFVPNQFLVPDKSMIQCSSHGALFEIETGECLAGPCTGQSLQKVPFEIQQGQVCILVQNA